MDVKVQMITMEYCEEETLLGQLSRWGVWSRKVGISSIEVCGTNQQLLLALIDVWGMNLDEAQELINWENRNR